MNEVLLSNHKLVAVFAVILIILIGMIFYLFSIDKKVKQIEESLKH